MPNRNEGYDISNIQGTEQVGSLVVWENGGMKKEDYKRFRVKTVVGPDDFASLEEVLRRRFGKALEQGTCCPIWSSSTADAASSTWREGVAGSGLDYIPVASLAKQQEEVYRFDRGSRSSSTPPRLPTLQKIRDEAHRFAITYHKTLRSQRTLTSVLDTIPGVGPTIRTMLLKTLAPPAACVRPPWRTWPPCRK